jgi:hypothetical protein
MHGARVVAGRCWIWLLGGLVALLASPLVASAAAAGGYDIYYDVVGTSGERSIYAMSSEGKDPKLFVADGMEPDWTTDAKNPTMVFEQDNFIEGEVDSAHRLAVDEGAETGGFPEVVGVDGRHPKLVKLDPLAPGPCGDVEISPGGDLIVYG